MQGLQLVDQHLKKYIKKLQILIYGSYNMFHAILYDKTLEKGFLSNVA